MGRKLKKDTPVRVHDPVGFNAQYKNQLGLVKDSRMVLGGVWSYKVKLNSGKVAWFIQSELRALENT